ncbi:alpha-hydroxy acid oxidase (plasmid) [Kozakia baliensis]|uniref:alpha-hydroxy acid oxidase n=1 Tax=Kozakia baliensis TaxID=153496 RepID=UPI00345BFDF4
MAARRTLPRWLFDYVDGGSYSESSLRRNREAFSTKSFVPYALRSCRDPNPSVTLMGRRQAAPLVLAPVGMGGILSAEGEVAAVRAAARASVPACVSHFSIQSIEVIAKAVDPSDLMFQLYVFRDRHMTRDMVMRAWHAGVRTLVVTVDTPITPMRERDARNGFRSASRLSIHHLAQMALCPRWTWQAARRDGRRMANLDPYGMGPTLFAQAAAIARGMDPTFDWDDIAWLRDMWKGKFVVKGVLHPEDTRRAAALGADGVVLSNHGGRQLDGAASGFDMLEANVVVASGRLSVLIDGGFRYGSDVVKAMALGADGVMIGRPWAFGLAARGEQGVSDVIDYFLQGIRSTMTLLGTPDVATLRASCANILCNLDRPMTMSGSVPSVLGDCI